MLTDEDIQKIINAHKEVFPTKVDFESFKDEMKKDFADLQISVDAYAKKQMDIFKKCWY